MLAEALGAIFILSTLVCGCGCCLFMTLDMSGLGGIHFVDVLHSNAGEGWDCRFTY